MKKRLALILGLVAILTMLMSSVVLADDKIDPPGPHSVIITEVAADNIDLPGPHNINIPVIPM